MFAPFSNSRLIRRRLRALSRPLAIALLALCLAVASGFGGISYTLCLGTGRVHLTSCCPAATGGHVARAARQSEAIRPLRVCCEGHRVDSLPRTQNALSNQLVVMPAALVATLSLEEMFDRGSPPADSRTRRAWHPVRAGPESPLYALHRVYLI